VTAYGPIGLANRFFAKINANFFAKINANFRSKLAFVCINCDY